MTIAHDHTATPSLLTEPNWDELADVLERVLERLREPDFPMNDFLLDMAQPRMLTLRDPRHDSRHDSYCWCSPSRGMFQQRDVIQIGAHNITVRTWMPEEPSTELAIREVIPAPKTPSRIGTWVLAGATVAGMFVAFLTPWLAR